MKVKYILTTAIFFNIALYSPLKAEDLFTNRGPIPLTASIIKGHMKPRPRSLTNVPIVKHEGNNLVFEKGHEPFFLTIKNENDISYETYIAEQTTLIRLPSELQGECQITLISSNGNTYVGNFEFD